MYKLTKFAVNHPISIFMGMLAIVLLGYISYSKLGITLFPDLETPKLYVSVEAGEKPPTEIEEQFIKSIESIGIRQEGANNVTSLSSTGKGIVTISYDWDIDMDAAYIDLQKSLSQISQQDDLDELDISQEGTDESPILIAALINENIENLDELRKTAENYIRNELVRIDGIAEVELVGEEESEIRISTSNYKLNSFGLTLSDIENAITDYNQTLSGGTIEELGTEYIVKGVGLLDNIKTFEDIIVAHTNNTPVYLRDVASISMENKDPDNIVRINGQRCIGLSIYKEPNANTVNTIEVLQKELKTIEKSLPGYELKAISNQGNFIESAIDEVKTSALYGILLAILVLFLFLKRMGVTFIVSLSIPISIIATFNLMYFEELSLNVMTLGGLALGAGMLVDNAIVVMENIFRNHEKGQTPKEASCIGTSQVMGAITASTITTIVVFLPIVYIHGTSGELFKDEALTVTFSLIASLFTAMFVIPTLYSKIYKKPLSQSKKSFRFSSYPKVLNKVLNHKYWILFLGTILVLISLWITPYIGSEFMPQGETKEFTMKLQFPQGSSINYTDHAVKTMEKVSKEYLGENVVMIYSQIGPSSDDNTDIQSITEGNNTAYIKYVLSPKCQIPYNTILESLSSITQNNSDIKVSFINDQALLSSMIGQESAPIVINVKGDDLDQLEKLSNQIKEHLNTIPEISNPISSMDNQSPEINLVVDKIQLGINELTLDNIITQVSAYLQGNDSGETDIDGEVKDITIQLPKITPQELGQLIIKNGEQQYTLDQIAKIENKEAPQQIFRDNQTRSVQITAQLSQNAILDKTVAKVKKELLDIAFPVNYNYTITGAEQERQESLSSLLFALILSIVLVYMVMASLFESLLHPFTILFSIPLALTGVVITFGVLGKPFNIMALIGTVMLVGIAVNSSILLVDRINQIKKKEASLREAILKASQQRIRPIIMTALTTILALLPLTISYGENSELRSSMALAVIGGLVTSTLLTLIIIPCVYESVEGIRVHFSKSKNK